MSFVKYAVLEVPNMSYLDYMQKTSETRWEMSVIYNDEFSYLG